MEVSFPVSSYCHHTEWYSPITYLFLKQLSLFESWKKFGKKHFQKWFEQCVIEIIHFTTYNFQSVVLSLHLHHHPNDGSSYIHINATGLFQDHKLLSFSNMQFRQIHQLHITVRLQQLSLPVNGKNIFKNWMVIRFLSEWVPIKTYTTPPGCHGNNRTPCIRVWIISLRRW